MSMIRPDQKRTYDHLRAILREAESLLYHYRDGHLDECRLCEALRAMVIDRLVSFLCRIDPTGAMLTPRDRAKGGTAK
jgi:hypothetical protein